MAGYLDQYGVGEERREKITRRLVLALVGLVIGAGVLYWLFQNYRHEKQVKHFFELLAAHDYKGAYALWGCTDVKPCPDYAFAKFLEDWGPQNKRVDAASSRITGSESCGSGVIVDVDVGQNQLEKLWVERDTLTIGFSPLRQCPSRSPLKIFLKRMRDRLRG